MYRHLCGVHRENVIFIQKIGVNYLTLSHKRRRRDGKFMVSRYAHYHTDIFSAFGEHRSSIHTLIMDRDHVFSIDNGFTSVIYFLQ